MEFRRSGRFVLYLLYACLLTGLLLVVRFPAERMRTVCARAVEKAVPGISCRIGRVDFDLPFTLRLQAIRLAPVNGPGDAALVIDTLTARIDFRHKSCRVTAQAYGGHHEGRLQLEKGAGMRADIGIHDADLTQCSILRALLGRKVSGTLSMVGRYAGPLDDIAAGEASGTVTVREGTVELLQPVLYLNAVNYQRIESAFRLRDGLLSLNNGVLQGTEMNGAFAGTLRLANPLGDSWLDIGGNLTPLLPADADPQWKRRATLFQTRYKQATWPFVIRGTLAGPLFRLGG